MSGPISGEPISARDNALSVHILGMLAKHLGLDPSSYLPTVSGVRSGVDWDGMRSDMIARIDQLKAAALAAQSEARKLEKLLDAAKAERDEAQAEVRAMLNARREEEERARMRLLEHALHALNVANTGYTCLHMLPTYVSARERNTKEEVTPAEYRAALLADLDALVALGLRGEVEL